LLSSQVKSASPIQLLEKQLFSHPFEIPKLIFSVRYIPYSQQGSLFDWINLTGLHIITNLGLLLYDLVNTFVYN
jgi:hypothetical protein